MKAEINLLPPDFQASRYAQLYWRGVEYIVRRLVAALLLVAVMFAGAYAFFRSIAVATPLQLHTSGTAGELKKKVEQANELVTTVDMGLRATAPWMGSVGQILHVMPAEITLQSVSLAGTPPSITIKGITQSRAAVVTFEQAVKALPWVAGIESPLQNFASGFSTPFTLIIKRHPIP